MDAKTQQRIKETISAAVGGLLTGYPACPLDKVQAVVEIAVDMIEPGLTVLVTETTKPGEQRNFTVGIKLKPTFEPSDHANTAQLVPKNQRN